MPDSDSAPDSPSDSPVGSGLGDCRDWPSLDQSTPLRSKSLNKDVPSTARVYNYWLGGKDNFAADRALAEEVESFVPNAHAHAMANRLFLGRTVRYLTEGLGIDQFLDLGTGFPMVGATHEVAHQFVEDATVVYVDNDPVVLAHGRALLCTDESMLIDCDITDPRMILADQSVWKVLDRRRPIGVLAGAILHFVEDAQTVADTLADALAPGSALAISHAVASPAVCEAAKMYQRATSQAFPRTVREITELFDGMELVEPGVVPVTRWNPDIRVPWPVPRRPEYQLQEHADDVVYGGLAIKPSRVPT